MSEKLKTVLQDVDTLKKNNADITNFKNSYASFVSSYNINELAQTSQIKDLMNKLEALTKSIGDVDIRLNKIESI